MQIWKNIKNKTYYVFYTQFVFCNIFSKWAIKNKFFRNEGKNVIGIQETKHFNMTRTASDLTYGVNNNNKIDFFRWSFVKHTQNTNCKDDKMIRKTLNLSKNYEYKWKALRELLSQSNYAEDGYMNSIEIEN